MIELRPFQRKFIKGALSPGIRRAALSLSRGQGKSTLAAHILRRCLTPGDVLHQPGKEYILLAGSLEQARLVFKPLTDDLPADGSYRISDSTTRMGIRHMATGTTLRVISSRAKSAFGLGANNPLVVMDEPGATDTVGGQLMNDALDTALGKPGSDMRVWYVGTLSPATAGWWHDLVADGSRGNTYVLAIKGNPDRWDNAAEIRRCNPLMWHYAESRKLLLAERDEARADTRLAARFKSFRLNIPSQDEADTLLTVADWQRTLAREVPERKGRPVVAVDLGAGRAWSAGVALWPSGRTEALACAPGLPSLEAQETRDRVPAGTYRKLADQGSLLIASGLRVQPPAQLVAAMRERWGRPDLLVCDRFRLDELKDCVGDWEVEPRMTRWSESAFDIRSLRRMAKDGPLAVAEDSRALLTASLSAALVQNDDAGSVRMVKNSSNNTGRDDAAFALTLGAGALVRAADRPKTRWRSRGLV